MQNQRSWVGGARLDIFNATWPFAKLTVSRSKMELKVRFWGKMAFTPAQITEIKPVGILPYLGKGIQIHHTLDTNQFPSKVIFWYFAKDTQELVDELRSWGYGAV